MVEAGNRLQQFLADASNKRHIAVIICPGGSYSWLAMKTEGVAVAKWLQSNGIDAYVLKYRVATPAAYITGYRVLGLGNAYPDMLDDILDALKYVYGRYDGDTMIGVMGFSAGGHLAMLSYIYNSTQYKPSFLCTIYPVVSMIASFAHHRSRRGALGVWRQFNRKWRELLSIERHIPSDCPPVFIANCVDDPVVRFENSVLLDSVLTEKGIRHKYIQYKTGGHGFGASETKGTAESRQWKNEFLLWILNLKAERR